MPVSLSLEERVAALSKASLIRDSFAAEDIRKLAQTTAVRALPPGAAVYSAGDEAHTFAVVVTGLLAKAGVGATLPMGPGEVIGAMPLLARDPEKRRRTTGVVATGETVLIDVPYSALAAVDGREFVAQVAEETFLVLVAVEARLQTLGTMYREMTAVPHGRALT